MTRHAYQGSMAMQTARGAQGLLGESDQLCAQSHYIALVEARRDVEIYQLGDFDCRDCLQRMIDKHAALVEVFRGRLAALSGSGGSR